MIDRWFRRLAAAAALGCAAPLSVAAEAPRKTVAVYSNVCFHAQSGDILGERVFLFRVRDGFQVLFQEAIGEMQLPILEKALVSGDQIRVELHRRSEGPSIFVGSITPETITGSYLNGDGRRITLTRQHEEENGFPNC
jgi:hypothetical protein